MTETNKVKKLGRDRQKSQGGCPEITRLLSWADGTLLDTDQWYKISRHARRCDGCADLSRRYLGLVLDLANVRPIELDARKIYQTALSDLAEERVRRQALREAMMVPGFNVEAALDGRGSLIHLPAKRYKPAEILDRDPE